MVNKIISILRSWPGILRFGFSILRETSQRKYILRWLESMRKDYLLEKPSPWISFEALDFVQGYLKERRDLRIFEYGSGGSTLFWLNLEIDNCVSIEHDPDWFDVIRKRATIYQNKALDYRLVLPELIAGNLDANDPANPEFYLSTAPIFANHSFYRYATQIDEFPDAYFDLILVDGRSRPACLVHSVPKVKPGGIIILDNADRDYYTAQTAIYLENFEHKIFNGVAPTLRVKLRTDVYIKKSKE